MESQSTNLGFQPSVVSNPFPQAFAVDVNFVARYCSRASRDHYGSRVLLGSRRQSQTCIQRFRKTKGNVIQGKSARLHSMAQKIVNYFEDIVPGMTVEFGRYRMSEEEIVAFARAYDPQPFHTDREAAEEQRRRRTHRQRLAHLLRCDEDDRRSFQPRGKHLAVPGRGRDSLAGSRKTRRRASVRLTVLEARESRSKPDRGIFRIRAEILNQKDEIVMTFTADQYDAQETGTHINGDQRQTAGLKGLKNCVEGRNPGSDKRCPSSESALTLRITNDKDLAEAKSRQS